MASKNVKVSQDLSEILRVSQSRIFCKAVLESKSRCRNPKTSKSLGLVEKNAGLPVSQRLVFTICRLHIVKGFERK